MNSGSEQSTFQIFAMFWDPRLPSEYTFQLVSNFAYVLMRTENTTSWFWLQLELEPQLPVIHAISTTSAATCLYEVAEKNIIASNAEYIKHTEWCGVPLAMNLVHNNFVNLIWKGTTTVVQQTLTQNLLWKLYAQATQKVCTL